jgi:GntR family transcriptional regulator, transcriptional repressor for pyruvate dehydrogenase complex
MNDRAIDDAKPRTRSRTSSARTRVPGRASTQASASKSANAEGAVRRSRPVKASDSTTLALADRIDGDDHVTKVMQAELGISPIRPAYEQAADQLRALILGGLLKAGDQLPVEGRLSAMFGVSRSTIREALRLLSSQGLIRTVRGVSGGTFVSEAQTSDVSEYLETSLGLLSGTRAITPDELLEARDLYEVPAASLAATRRTEEHLEAMRQVVAEEKAETARGRRFKQHHRFHSLVLEAAGNRLLRLTAEPVFGVIHAQFLQDRSDDEYWRKIDNDHEVILEAIALNQAEDAGRLMRDHLTRLRSMYTLRPEDS